MGLFGLFGKKDEKVEIILDTEVRDYVKEKKAEVQNEKQVPRNKILENMVKLISELEAEIQEIEKIDLNERKADERAKIIIKDNLNNYVVYLRQLISNLSQVNQEEFENIPKKINEVFSDFERKSLISFQKATFLIGKELEKVRESIAKFFRFLKC